MRVEDSERIDRLETRVGKIEERMAVAETDIKDIKDDLRDIKDNTKWILRLLIGGIVTGVVSGAIGLIFASIHIS
jgi:tetrahydromethanopterin S-methyltransferase subunit F